MQVKEGWGPLCKFLNVPEPSIPFPRVNDTDVVLAVRRDLLIVSWLIVVGLPILLAALGYGYGFGAQDIGFFIAAVFLFIKLMGSIFMNVIFKK